MGMMKPRDVGGAIRRAKTVYVWVQYSDTEGVYVAVAKPTAREIVDDAKEKNLEINAEEEKGELYIGVEFEAVTDAPESAPDSKPDNDDDEEEEEPEETDDGDDA